MGFGDAGFASNQYMHTNNDAPGGITGYPWSAALWFMPLALDGTTRYFLPSFPHRLGTQSLPPFVNFPLL